MTEMRATYTIGGLTLVEPGRDVPTDELLDGWFRLTETGLVRLKDGKPPQKVLELLGYRLATDLDELRWQIGDWAVLMASYYGLAAYERLVEVCGLNHKATAVEDWAYICRGVRQAVRHPGLSIFYHRLVVPMRDWPEKQRDWLEQCVTGEWSISRFEAELRQAGEKSPRNEKPAYEDDRNYELAVENDRLRNELADANSRLDAYAGTLPAPEVARGQVRAVRDTLRRFAQSMDWVEVVKDPDKWFRAVKALLETAARDLEELET